MSTKPFEILLVEDNLGDVRLMTEVFKDSDLPHHLNTVSNGIEAIDFLRRNGDYTNAPRPDLIMLDLNLPKKDGREVLVDIKTDRDLKLIPVVVLTSSEAHQDVINSYALQANCYVSKPVDLDELIKKVRCIADFWLNVVKLPREEYVTQ